MKVPNYDQNDDVYNMQLSLTSSKNNNAGWVTNSIPIDNRRFWPPDIPLTKILPTIVSQSQIFDNRIHLLSLVHFGIGYLQFRSISLWNANSPKFKQRNKAKIKTEQTQKQHQNATVVNHNESKTTQSIFTRENLQHSEL